MTDRLARLGPEALGRSIDWITRVLKAQLGADRPHVPMFRRFPQDVPADTYALWRRRVLVHIYQSPDQPCVLCGASGTTHVLRPCEHVACDRCFDPGNHSGCPVCYAAVDPSSPFFGPQDVLPTEVPRETVRFRPLALGEQLPADARALFTSLCARTQAMSPADRDRLVVLLKAFGEQALAWLPEQTPVRENVAIIFGTLFKALPADRVLPVARAHFKTATDVLRFIAVYSDADSALLPQARWVRVEQLTPRHPLLQKLASVTGLRRARHVTRPVYVSHEVRRFKVAKLGRSLRRVLLGLLEGFSADALTEDLLRHRSYWVWVGEFLHPHEYASRFPKVARAFQVVRTKAPDGTPAPEFRSFASRVERALLAGDHAGAAQLLSTRPGELARRFDHLMRGASERGPVASALVRVVPKLATPLLLTLRSHLRARFVPAPVRVYWPKAEVSLAPTTGDNRKVLDAAELAPVLEALDLELLSRFERKPPLAAAMIDAALKDVTVPFNERTTSRAAVNLTRGSRVPVEAGKTTRLFLHWCEPERGDRTDVDLSIGFYDTNWSLVGTCSYYHQKLQGRGGHTVAVSSGDYTSAPFPDGASEFVDLDRAAALASGFRWAVMLVNAYSGLPFSKLERAFAGVMFRDDTGGAHFDPRTVRLKFALNGGNGIFMPLVLDLQRNELHWLDVYARGSLAFNNVANSDKDVARLVPALLAYFGTGTRPTMYDIALLHAAARCARVTIRGGERSGTFIRRSNEATASFLARILDGTEADAAAESPGESPMLAALFEGDCVLPDGSESYVLFPGECVGSVQASDLLS